VVTSQCSGTANSLAMPSRLNAGTGARAGRAPAPGSTCAPQPDRGHRPRAPRTPSRCPRRTGERFATSNLATRRPHGRAVRPVTSKARVLYGPAPRDDERPRLRVTRRRRPARGLEQHLDLLLRDLVRRVEPARAPPAPQQLIQRLVHPLSLARARDGSASARPWLSPTFSARRRSQHALRRPDATPGTGACLLVRGKHPAARE
jgi:hypothetical protein